MTIPVNALPYDLTCVAAAQQFVTQSVAISQHPARQQRFGILKPLARSSHGL